MVFHSSDMLSSFDSMSRIHVHKQNENGYMQYKESFTNDNDVHSISKYGEKEWVKSYWPFVDSSTYFPWRVNWRHLFIKVELFKIAFSLSFLQNYRSSDSVLLTMIFCAILIMIVFMIICIGSRSRKCFCFCRRKRARNELSVKKTTLNIYNSYLLC